ncbi:hypothetical protein EWM64_g10403 [Hericium alpestre]|uniref:Uncharacterized protein n=1 Tax=Hericium alpestre TaxID=135208 RepID=A0A4Y9ZHG1_9AGAM|nr:hypothetical protein EWM64_g10403 [Hericium alpestre]
MRIIPRAITCIQKLREEVEELKSRDQASLVAIQNLQQRNAYLEQERQMLRASVTELQEREMERNNLILEMQHRIRYPEAGHFMTA